LTISIVTTLLFGISVHRWLLEGSLGLQAVGTDYTLYVRRLCFAATDTVVVPLTHLSTVSDRLSPSPQPGRGTVCCHICTI